MSKGLNKHELDFEILELNNTFNIYFLDASYYFETPEMPILKVLIPGNNNMFTLNIIPNKINVLNSHNLGLTSVLENADFVSLGDGIYSFTYKICPYNYLYKTKHYLRTDNIQCKLDKIFENLDLENCLESSRKELILIQLLLDSGKANARLNNIEKANKDFQLACKKINRLYNGLSL